MNFVSRSQHNLYGNKHPKRRKNEEKGVGTHSHAPRAHSMRIGHGEFHTYMRLGNEVSAPSTAGQKRLSYFFVGKARIFSPNPGENSPYKYCLPDGVNPQVHGLPK